MKIVLLVGMFTGWAMIGHVVTTRALAWRKRHRAVPARRETQLERIARLEIACGVGLKYGEDALVGVRTRFANRERLLSAYDLKSFGGAVERVCWACRAEFKPYEHADWFAKDSRPWPSLYGDKTNPDRDPLDETLCPSCLRNARAELEYGVPVA